MAFYYAGIYIDMDEISFQPDLEKLKSTTDATHFILSGYLRNSMTFKTYYLAMQHYNIKAFRYISK